MAPYNSQLPPSGYGQGAQPSPPGGGAGQWGDPITKVLMEQQYPQPQPQVPPMPQMPTPLGGSAAPGGAPPVGGMQPPGGMTPPMGGAPPAGGIMGPPGGMPPAAMPGQIATPSTPFTPPGIGPYGR